MSDRTWYKLVLVNGVFSTLSKIESVKKAFSLAVQSGQASAQDVVFYREDLKTIEIYFPSVLASVASQFDVSACTKPLPDERLIQPLTPLPGYGVVVKHFADYP